MSNVSGVSAIGAVSSSSPVSEQAIVYLQTQMLRYSQSALSNTKTSVTYNTLENAIQIGNIPIAQAALAQLQRQLQGAQPTSRPDVSAAPPATPSVELNSEPASGAPPAPTSDGVDVAS